MPRPSTYLNWVPSGNPSFIVQPTSGQQATGWTAAERPPFQYLNWLFYYTDQWIQYFDSFTFSSIGAFDGAAPSINGLVLTGGVFYAQSASATVPGMVNISGSTQQFQGPKEFLTFVGIGGTNGNALLSLGNGGPLQISGVTQASAWSQTTWPATTTGAGYSYIGACTTAATSFTMGVRAQFYAQNVTKGAGSTISRDIAYLADQPIQGTNNALLADGTSFVGNYFINQAGSAVSLFTGNVTFAGDMIPTGISASSANSIASAMNATGADTIFSKVDATGLAGIPVAVASYSPGVSIFGGTQTGASGGGFFYRIGKLIHVQFSQQWVQSAAAATGLKITIPVGSALQGQFCRGDVFGGGLGSTQFIDFSIGNTASNEISSVTTISLPASATPYQWNLSATFIIN